LSIGTNLIFKFQIHTPEVITLITNRQLVPIDILNRGPNAIITNIKALNTNNIYHKRHFEVNINTKIAIK